MVQVVSPRIVSSRAGSVGLVALAVATLVAASPANAQTPTGGTSGTAEQELRRPAEPRSNAVPFRIEKPRGQGDAAAAQRFLLRDVVLDGAQSLDPAQVRAAVAPLIGREITLGELFGAADAITTLYANAGYPLSFAIVPAQDVKDGVVRLRIVEGTLDKIEVAVEGRGALVSRERIRAAVARQFASLVNGRPVRSADLERALLLIQDWPGVRLSSVLRPSATTENAADLVVTVEVDPIEGRLSFDNRLRSDFGTYRGGVGAEVFSLFVPGDRLTLDTRASVKFDAYQQYYARYETPLGRSGVRAFGSWSEAHTEASKGLLGFLDFAGKETVARIGGSVPIIRSRAQNLSFNLEGARINSRSSILGVTLIRDRIRTIEGRLTYDVADRSGGRTLIEGGVIQGLAGLGATPRGNPLASRAFGTPEFTAVTLRGTYDLGLPSNWRLSTELDGQLMVAGSALASVECSYGGDRVGRGYAPGAIGGDHCVRGLIELRKLLTVGPARVEPFLFGDFGAVRQKGALDPSEARTSDAASVGAGLRAVLPFGLVGEAVAAVPLDKTYADSRKDVRVFFNLNLFF